MLSHKDSKVIMLRNISIKFSHYHDNYNLQLFSKFLLVMVLNYYVNDLVKATYRQNHALE